MPPKVRISKEDILQAALELVRRGGAETVNARSLAAALQCSTQPIFSNFTTMEELEKSTIAAAYELYISFIRQETQRGEYPVYKAYGMAYLRFAMEEPALFKLLFMRDRRGEDLSPPTDYLESEQLIMQANGVSRETAQLIHLETWACVHGIGVMLATSFLPLEWDLISRMVSDAYQGIRAIHTQGGTEKS